GSILILYVLGTLKPVFLGRYLDFSILFSCVFVAKRLLTHGIVGAGALLVIICFQILNVRLIKTDKMDYRNVAQVIKQFKGEDDIVVVNTKDNVGLFLYYYEKDAFLANAAPDSASKAHGIFGINSV